MNVPSRARFRRPTALIASRSRKPDRSTLTDPSAPVSTTSPDQTTEGEKEAATAFTWSASAPTARKRVFSNAAKTRLPTLRKTTTWA
ncbi:hypothetical protein D3C81_1931750 [compost metagenome]